ncbi:hypothetical protein DFH29DRAFT_507094 [Suillus ampliporus]|nr:hypothetical protein DFH29DRAFT_507094 [Suillus ampliporus]
MPSYHSGHAIRFPVVMIFALTILWSDLIGQWSGSSTFSDTIYVPSSHLHLHDTHFLLLYSSGSQNVRLWANFGLILKQFKSRKSRDNQKVSVPGCPKLVCPAFVPTIGPYSTRQHITSMYDNTSSAISLLTVSGLRTLALTHSVSILCSSERQGQQY